MSARTTAPRLTAAATRSAASVLRDRHSYLASCSVTPASSGQINSHVRATPTSAATAYAVTGAAVPPRERDAGADEDPDAERREDAARRQDNCSVALMRPFYVAGRRR